jgi:putative membrane protein
MRTRMTILMSALAAAAALACSNPPVTTASAPIPPSPTEATGATIPSPTPHAVPTQPANPTTAATSGGEIATVPGGLQPADVRGMTDANIVAHIAAGDSLEVEVSRAGASHAHASNVKAFAERMVSVHSAHMQTVRDVAVRGSITPAAPVSDTLAESASRQMMSSLSGLSDTAALDRQFMRDEVTMHQHMLQDLTLMRPQATGATQHLIDQTIPVVRQHLADAEAIFNGLGGI